jgi:predicted membrane GTPase involved in stress response
MYPPIIIIDPCAACENFIIENTIVKPTAPSPTMNVVIKELTMTCSKTINSSPFFSF